MNIIKTTSLGWLKSRSHTLLNKFSKKKFSNSNCMAVKHEHITFFSKAKLSQNAYLLRFLLEKDDKVLGNKIGEYVELEMEIDGKRIVRRPLSPVSLDTDKGFIDFVVKVYNDVDKIDTNNEFGIFSRNIVNLEVYIKYINNSVDKN